MGAFTSPRLLDIHMRTALINEWMGVRLLRFHFGCNPGVSSCSAFATSNPRTTRISRSDTIVSLHNLQNGPWSRYKIARPSLALQRCL